MSIVVSGAVAGLADQPLQVLMSNGSATGTSATRKMMGGVSRALVGAVTKPIGGVAEFVSQTGLGLLHGTGLVMLPQRKRSPMTVSSNAFNSSITKYME